MPSDHDRKSGDAHAAAGDRAEAVPGELAKPGHGGPAFKPGKCTWGCTPWRTQVLLWRVH